MALRADTHDAGERGNRASASELLSDIGASEELVAVSGSGPQGPWRRFVISFFAACVLAVTAVGVVNLAVDPTGLWGNDLFYEHPTDLELKSELLRRSQPFHTLVLGSSRAYRIDPARVRELTGHSAFNGAIAGGTVGLYDTVFDKAIAAHKGSLRSVIFLLDEDKFRATPARETARGKLQQTFSFSTLQASARFVQSHVSAVDPSPYRSDGFLLIERAVRANGSAGRRGVDSGAWGGFRDPRQRRPFETFLRTANAHAIRPVIVLTPIHPDVFKSATPERRRAHDAFVRYVLRLRRRYSLFVIDASHAASFGGTSDGFFDGVHMDAGQSDKLLEMVTRRAASAL